MCGIVGYVGHQDAVPVLLEGLARLEYRGYDSAGVAVARGGHLRVHKRAGKVRELAGDMPKRLSGPVGIAHTRWATHGGPSDANAHPHLDPDGPRRGRPQRHHRGRRPAAGQARGRGRRVRLRDRHRGARPPDRPRGRRRPRRGRAPRAVQGARRLRHRRARRPPARPPGAGPQRQPGADRDRRSPDARRFRRLGARAPCRAGRLPRGRRGGHGHRRRVHHHDARRPPDRQDARHASTGAPTTTTAAATSTSCARRSSSSPRRSTPPCAGAWTRASRPRTSAA